MLKIFKCKGHNSVQICKPEFWEMHMGPAKAKHDRQTDDAQTYPYVVLYWSVSSYQTEIARS